MPGPGFFFFQAEDGIRDVAVTGVQTCALPISCTARIPARPISTTAPRAPGAEEKESLIWVAISSRLANSISKPMLRSSAPATAGKLLGDVCRLAIGTSRRPFSCPQRENRGTPEGGARGIRRGEGNYRRRTAGNRGIGGHGAGQAKVRGQEKAVDTDLRSARFIARMLQT